MLDGSARYTQVVWDGFSMYDGGTASTKGLTLHIAKGNATKSSLVGERGDNFRDFYQSVRGDNGQAMPPQTIRLEFLFDEGTSVNTAFETFDVVAKFKVDKWKKKQEEHAKAARIVGAKVMP